MNTKTVLTVLIIAGIAVGVMFLSRQWGREAYMRGYAAGQSGGPGGAVGLQKGNYERGYQDGKAKRPATP
jgi:hypothetical protein